MDGHPVTPPTAAFDRRSALLGSALGIASVALPQPSHAASLVVQSTPTSGGSLSFDGGGGHLSIAVTSTADLVPGTDDYTIEWWVKEDAASSKGYPRMFALGSDSITQLGVSREFSNYQLVLFHGGSPILPFPVGAPDGLKGSWHHLAVCRAGGQVRVFLDGTKVADPITNADQMGRDISTNGAGPFRIGARVSEPASTSGENLFGLLTDLRYVIGRALYTGETLTVPTSPLPVVSDTALLFRATTAETMLMDASGGSRDASSVAIGASSVAWSSDSPYA